MQTILDEANEDTLKDVTAFVQDSMQERSNQTNRETETTPAGFIVTGPNIASQGFLFEQLSGHLRAEVNGPVVALRSGDDSNLKAILKKVIRDATNQKTSLDGDDEFTTGPGVSRIVLLGNICSSDRDENSSTMTSKYSMDSYARRGVKQ